MADILKGVQFRTMKSQLPSWKTEENYTDWADCGSLTSFPSGTEFRVTPVIRYVVKGVLDKTVLTSKIKNEAMAKVASMLVEDKFASIRQDEDTQLPIASYLSDQGIQFKLSGSDKWLNPPHFGGTSLNSPIRFRVRPDNYFQVDIKTGIAQSQLTFDDVDDLEKYLTKQLRTSENNITITRRSYGLSLF